MYRILITECKQEVSSFNPVRSHYDDFVVSFGEAVLARHHGVQSEIAGALEVFEARDDIRLIPTYSAHSMTSGGTLTASDFTRIAGEFLDSIRATPEVDGVYLSLHGAMSSEGEDDPEGYLLTEVRKILGERIPIVASFDLHGILTDRILEHCNAIVLYHTYPHVDFKQTGERSARLLLRILERRVRPVTARVKIPALVRGDELVTATGVFGQFIRAAQAIERSPGGLSAGMFIGNPFTDVPDLRTNAVVVTDDDRERARHEAISIASGFWSVRERMQVPLVSLQESVRIACDSPGTTILVDAADATSSGASGDSNAILRGLVEAGYSGSALVPIVDQPAVQAAFAAAVGQHIKITLGGSLDRQRFRPLPLEARVHMLAEGRFRNESWGTEWNGGPTAVLQSGAFTVIVTSRPVHLFDMRDSSPKEGPDMDRSEWLNGQRREAEERYTTLWAPSYGETWGTYSNTTHQRFIRKLLALLPQPSTILDAACGAGRYIGLLLEPGHAVVGIDQSQGMLDRAQSNFPGVRFERVGLQELAFQEAFDAAICVDAMEHVFPEDWLLVLSNFHRALKPGAYLYLTVELAEKSDVEHAFSRGQNLGLPIVYGEVADEGVYHYYPAVQQVRTWLDQGGFEVVAESTGDGYYHFIVRRSAPDTAAPPTTSSPTVL